MAGKKRKGSDYLWNTLFGCTRKYGLNGKTHKESAVTNVIEQIIILTCIDIIFTEFKYEPFDLNMMVHIGDNCDCMRQINDGKQSKVLICDKN